MAERSAKVRKVLGCIGLSSNVSQLSRVLAAIRDLSDSERDAILSLSAHQLQRGIGNVFDQVSCKITVTCVSGGPLHLDGVSWTKALQYAINKSDSLRALSGRLHEQYPNTATDPWHIVIYADETTPGNVLALDVARKTFVVRATVREFGPTVIKNAAAWIPLLFVRSSVLARISGGMAAVWRMILRRLFIEEQVSTRGVPVVLARGSVRLYFAAGTFLLDGDAVRGVYGAKGGNPSSFVLHV